MTAEEYRNTKPSVKKRKKAPATDQKLKPGIDPARWNLKANVYLVLPGTDGMVRVLEISGQYTVKNDDTKIEIVGDIMSEHDMTPGAALRFTMDPRTPT